MQKRHWPYQQQWNKNWSYSSFPLDFMSWLLKCTFGSHKNRTAGAAILCPAVCISDVINTAGKSTAILCPAVCISDVINTAGRSAAILCQAVCISDVINTAWMCGKSIRDVCFSLAFTGKKWTYVPAPAGAQFKENKRTSFVPILIEQTRRRLHMETDKDNENVHRNLSGDVSLTQCINKQHTTMKLALYKKL